MSATVITSATRPVVTEAAAQSVTLAFERLSRVVALLRQALVAQTARAHATRDQGARRRAAQRLFDMARRYDNSQPGFASDLRAAACRAMDDEQG